MQTWLINPFDPLPGEQEQLGRYGRLAEALRDAGHDVVWWSAGFSHRFKRPINSAAVRQAASQAGLDIRLLTVPSYERNVSVARLWSHYRFAQVLRRAMRGDSPPDLVLASAPPLESAREASRYGRRAGVPVVIDIQDQWPDNFASALPRALRPVRRLSLAPWYRLERQAYSLADAITGVAQGYVNRGLTVGGPKRFQRVFPLGVDLAELDVAVQEGRRQLGATRQNGPIGVLYSGSLSRSYDIPTILGTAILSQKMFDRRVHFWIAGNGESTAPAAVFVRENGLRNVTLLPFQPLPQYAKLFAQVDIGVNSSVPGSLIYLPNKIFYYMGAGLAVLNSIPGECAAMISRNACGLNYAAGDVESCFGALRSLVEAPHDLAKMRQASRRLAESEYDRKRINAQFVSFLNEVAAQRGAAP